MRRWFSMRKLDDKAGEILIYDEIGKSFWNDDAMSAKNFDDELKAMGDVETVNLRINSPGGDALDGIAIHNQIKNHPATFTATIDGIAASAASIIAVAADKIVMPENAFLLIHGASGFAMGNAQDMRAMADDLGRLDTSIVATYAKRSGQDEKKIAAIMNEDRLMDAKEAKELGLADEIKDAVKMAAKFSLRLLPENAAKQFKGVVKSVEPEPPPARTEKEPGVEQPVGPSAPSNRTDPPSAQVINIDDARREGRESTIAYVNEINDLCSLAGMPRLAAGYIRANESVETVRTKLIEARANEDERLEIQHHRAAPTQGGRERITAAWGRVTDNLNARVRK
ncbi:head maturation protease, ClpP-related [Bradyrhizobium sp. 2S1]|uniref:head maturation protease, ClpP-related n=1 Tax=Bradyrhizobium sp. 2S1 TaxID=1404429 RepID=UPI00140A4313|nr:head maturation protease, ClpP-related [Bradyrhizobium sp. 2S1]MCK7672391.1 Clp protease ClpP [Bradyrhizobium sp. 2S1]